MTEVNAFNPADKTTSVLPNMIMHVVYLTQPPKAGANGRPVVQENVIFPKIPAKLCLDSHLCAQFFIVCFWNFPVFQKENDFSR